jgi:hypothetical protein
MNGADMDDGKYKPDVTSYDYDAPVSESGELTSKFYLFRDAIQEATGKTPPAPPAPLPARAYAPVKLKEAASLWDTLPKPIQSDKILSMEDAGQSYGYILYRTTIGHAQSAELRIDELHRAGWNARPAAEPVDATDSYDARQYTAGHIGGEYRAGELRTRVCERARGNYEAGYARGCNADRMADLSLTHG